MSRMFAALGLAGLLLAASLQAQADKKATEAGLADYEFALPHNAWKTPFKDQVPILFVNRNMPEWKTLKRFWNPGTEKALDPATGTFVDRKAVRIKLPLGLNSNPPVPVENPMTVAKWKLGRKLFFDPVLSSDRTVSCSTCHDPKKGFTDQARFSTGIEGKKGGMSAPTVFNSAYHTFQFWDGRAASLEDQSQGPPQNPLEMFDGKGHAWKGVVRRLRESPTYVKEFKAVFGTNPTQDGVAKAIATFERTVFSGNSIHDRAEAAARVRLADAGTGDFTPKARDYAQAVKDAFTARDEPALKALKLDVARDADKAGEIGKRLSAGRTLYFKKARCSGCHVGDNFTDNAFHNLGVRASNGKLPASASGRYAAQPVGHKNPAQFGAFKTPTLRHLLGTAPYMHDGSEKDLEAVVEFYDKGGIANEYLDIRMRDEDAEKAWHVARASGKKYTGPEALVVNGKAIVPLKLKLTPQEKKDLVLFLRALQGDPTDPMVARPRPGTR